MTEQQMISKKWGIIGDGQLARMLALSAYPLGIRPVMLCSDPNSSGGQVCQQQVRGSINSRTDLHALLSQVDFAIIESEFVNCDLLESTGQGHKVIPSLSAIRTLQNKIEQKHLLKKLGISTSSFSAFSGKDSGWLDNVVLNANSKMVLKFATLGYDGKGVCILNKDREDRTRAERFMEIAKDRKIDIYAEERVDFVKELAMIAVRGKTGEFANYPLMITEQLDGVCKKVFGPAKYFEIDSSIEKIAASWCKKIADELNLIGAFGVEFFLSRGGSLLVNEIAPRVHNSGHFTQNAPCTSQFENHWRAVASQPLGSCNFSGCSAMLNVLGPKGLFSKESAVPPPLLATGSLHWYGKAGISPGRKLGHFNTYEASDARAQETLSRVGKHIEQHIEKWEASTLQQIPNHPVELKR